MRRLLLALLLATAARAGDGEEARWVIRVLDPAGAPVPRARIHVMEVGDGFWGDFEQDMRDGRHEHGSAHEGTRIRIEVMNPGDAEGRPLALGAACRGPLGPGEIVIRLEPEREIRGFVRTAGGEPVPGATVAACCDDTARIHSEAVSDRAGSFRLGRLGAFAYRLVVTPPEGFLAPEGDPVMAGATDVLLPVRRLVAPRLTIRGPASEPLPRCSVRLERPPAEDLVLVADEQGAVVLPYLDPAGAYPLHIDPPGDGPALPFFEPRWIPKSGEVVLARAYSVAGVVRRGDGTPVPGASVWVRDAPPGWSWFRLPDGSQQAALSDERGRFEVRRLPGPDATLFAVLVLDGGEEIRSPPVRVDGDGRQVFITLPVK